MKKLTEDAGYTFIECIENTRTKENTTHIDVKAKNHNVNMVKYMCLSVVSNYKAYE